MKKTLTILHVALQAVASFAWAHALLFVGPRTRAERLQACTWCDWRDVVNGIDYCRAENDGRGCTCPKSKAWPLGGLGYKTALRNWVCPIGRFGRFRKDDGLSTGRRTFEGGSTR